MNEELKLILGEYIGDIPVAHLRYKGNSRKFVTWTVISEVPAFSANDEDLCSICSVDVDIFSESNYLDIKTEINFGFCFLYRKIVARPRTLEYYASETGKPTKYEKGEIYAYNNKQRGFNNIPI
mgnify:CR=1 FL=1